MTLDDILQDIHALEQDLQSYERKYGVLSETFYESYMNGEEPDDDAWVMDWSAWAGTYEIWLRRKEQYRAAIPSRTLTIRYWPALLRITSIPRRTSSTIASPRQN